ncbi:MAG: SUMF1/EgtB/PvdO family nonheme iron enzyme [Verrucomicrobiota bacterium]
MNPHESFLKVSFPAVLAVSALLLILLSGDCPAQSRHALVIGNSNYQHSAPLRNPSSDARSIASVLEGSDFKVTLLLDGTYRQMKEGLLSFGKSLPQGSTSLLYFAGHGMRVGGESYLMPVDAKAESASTLEYEAVTLELALAVLDRDGEGAGLKIVILDSCRNNPYGRTWSGTRAPGANTGMTAPARTPQGTVLCFATDPRQTAADGRGENSPYTTGLLKHLFTPGLDLDIALRRVGAEVQQLTDGRQNPWRNSNFNGDFAFRETGDDWGLPLPDQEATQTATPWSDFEGKKAGESRRIAGIDFVWCPPGQFLMGSHPAEEGRSDSEMQHRVDLTSGFWIATTECTQGDWERLGGNNPSNFRDSLNPVDTVSWELVSGWLLNMNQSFPQPGGWTWRLPTEAEWEYACRAGAQSTYGFGNDSNELYLYGNSAMLPLRTFGEVSRDDRVQGRTAKVKSYAGNRWGIFDMHGNVAEWCLDWYVPHEIYDARDPTGPSAGILKVVKGGGWRSEAENCRSASRGDLAPGDRADAVGFRPVLGKRL